VARLSDYIGIFPDEATALAATKKVNFSFELWMPVSQSAIRDNWEDKMSKLMQP
jgi:hypothetical protein